MSDYISREALYNKTTEWEAQALAQVGQHMHDDDPAEWRRWFTILTERSAFKHDVYDAPAADVAPVVHGKWMDHVNPRNDDDWACSNCGSYFFFEAGDPIANGTNYCPNCGAKMDGGDHNAVD